MNAPEITRTNVERQSMLQGATAHDGVRELLGTSGRGSTSVAVRVKRPRPAVPRTKAGPLPSGVDCADYVTESFQPRMRPAIGEGAFESGSAPFRLPRQSW